MIPLYVIDTPATYVLVTCHRRPEMQRTECLKSKYVAGVSVTYNGIMNADHLNVVAVIGQIVCTGVYLSSVHLI